MGPDGTGCRVGERGVVGEEASTGLGRVGVGVEEREPVVTVVVRSSVVGSITVSVGVGVKWVDEYSPLVPGGSLTTPKPARGVPVLVGSQ